MNFFESILIIEMTDKTLRAAVAQKTFQGVRIRNQIELKKDSPYPVLTDEELSAVLSAIPNAPREAAVICGCTVLEISMEHDKLKKLRRAGKLKDALRWELEEYLTGDVGERLLGYEISRQKKTRRRRGKVAFGETPRDPIWVSALSAHQYSEVSTVLANQGKRLLRVYAPEACTAQAALSIGRGKEMLILDIEHTVSRVIVVADRAIRSLHSIPFGLENLPEGLESLQGKSFAQECKNLRVSVEGARCAIFVCGPGAGKKNLTDRLSAEFGERVQTLAPAGSGTDCTQLCNLFGAAVREFDVIGEKRLFGIDDSLPLKQRIKEKIHVFPIAVLGSIAILFALHFGVMHWQLHTLTNNIGELEKAKEVFQKQSEEYAVHQQQRSDLEKSIAESGAKIKFLEEGIDERREMVTDLLAKIPENSPGDLLTLRIEWEDMNDVFTVQGQAVSPESINRLALGLQDSLWWCRDVRVETIRKKMSKGKDDGGEEVEHLDFLLWVSRAESQGG